MLAHRTWRATVYSFDRTDLLSSQNWIRSVSFLTLRFMYSAKSFRSLAKLLPTSVHGCISMGIFSPLPRLNSHSHALSSHSHPIPIPMADLIPIPMGIPWDPWDPRLMGSHAHLTWQTQKTAVWNRSRRDRPISRELSVVRLDRSPISRLWRPVLYLQRAPEVLQFSCGQTDRQTD